MTYLHLAERVGPESSLRFSVQAAGRVPVLSGLGRTQTLLATVSDFSRYRQDEGSLPVSERQRIDGVARLVATSHRPGARPVVTIRVVGHADLDTPRRPAFEMKISGQRARAEQAALVIAIDRHAALEQRGPLARRIRWEQFAMGATRPLYSAPRTEAERARNRRVDILIEGVRCQGLSRQGLLMSATTHTQVAQACNVPPPAPAPPACTNPSPSQKATIRAGGIVFDADVVTTAFNPLPRGLVQQFVFANQPNTRALRFSCHRVEARDTCPTYIIPAWAYDGAVAATLPAGQSPGDREYGFVQTVRRSRLLHVYSGGAGRACSTTVPTRDAIAVSPAPWYQTAAVTTLDSSVPASLEDSPTP